MRLQQLLQSVRTVESDAFHLGLDNAFELATSSKNTHAHVNGITDSCRKTLTVRNLTPYSCFELVLRGVVRNC